MRRIALVALGVVLALWAPAVHAQIVRPKADIAPVVERSSIPGGSPVRVALQVSLPEGLHVQSNQPRDASLIPTELTVTPPPGVSVVEIVYPPSTDLKQVGS